MPGSDLGANRQDQLLDDIISDHHEAVQRLRDDIMADGRPPFSVQLTPEQQLARMDQMRTQLDPRALTADAQQEYQKLRQQVAKRRGGGR